MTYFTVVITAVLIGIVLATYLKLVASQNQNTMRSQAWNRSVAVLEAGIEEALAHLNKNAVYDLNNGTFTWNLSNYTDGWTTTADGGWQKTGYIDDDYYVVKIGPFTPGNTCPSIDSEGFVRETPTFAAARRLLSPFMAAAGQGSYVRRKVQCTTTNVPTFTKAIVAKNTIDMNGNNVRSDSYDSTNPSFSTNGRYDENKARDHGDVATNNSFTNSISIGNANIWGSIATGPNLQNPGYASATVGSQGKVGDAAWQSSNNRGIQDGHSRDDMNVYFPNVTPPFVSGLPADSAYTWTNNVNYKTTFRSSSDYVVSGLSGTVLVTAPNVRIRVNGDIKMTGNDEIRLAPGASVIMYLNGSSAALGGNGLLNGTGAPGNFLIFGTRNLTSLSFGGNGEITAAIYAPSADVTGNGGGNSVQDFSGAAIINSLKFNGHYSFHYDEALGRKGIYTGFVLTSWDEI